MHSWNGFRRRGTALVAVLVIGASARSETRSWRRIDEIPASAVVALAGDASGHRVAAASKEDVYQSEDGGASWHSSGPGGGEVLALAYTREGMLVAAGEQGVRVSEEGAAWRALDLAGQGARGSVRAVMEDPLSTGGLVLGTDAGVLLATREGRGWRGAGVLLAGRAVDRLARAPGGGLLAASETGLHQIDPVDSGRALRVAGRKVAAIASSGSFALAATEGGLLWGEVEKPWRELHDPAGLGRPTGALAAVPDRPGEFLAVTVGGLWHIAREVPPRRVAGAPPGETALSLLVLPGGRVLAGTDRGLYGLTLEEGRRATDAPPPGSRDGSVGEEFGALLWRDDPTIGEVRRAALQVSSLEPGRIRSNFHRVRWRALLPELSVSARRRGIRQRDHNQDQTFSSGATHNLFARSLDRQRERDLTVGAEWDLGALLFNPDELDVSDEARRVLTLRDDVLDEVIQIYFERHRALLALNRLVSAGSARPGTGTREGDLLDLRIKVEELTARLDAWTDGFFSGERERRIERRGARVNTEPKEGGDNHRQE